MKDQTVQAIHNGWQYNGIENDKLGVSLYHALVPENMAQGTKGLRSLADSEVHLNRCATVVLCNADMVLKIGHHLYDGNKLNGDAIGMLQHSPEGITVHGVISLTEVNEAGVNWLVELPCFLHQDP